MEDIQRLQHGQLPKALFEIPQPPKTLYMRGTLPSSDLLYLAVVGSRKYTSYGKDACETLIKGLKGYPIVIVSGLALGIDAIAHRAALDAGLTTIAFPGSGLSDKVLYPATNVRLAHDIIKSGGCLISEHDSDFHATLYSFPERNRLMAGIAKAVLIIEAQEKSGTLITARMALDYNRDVLAVPGSIFSNASRGTNHLIREGATPITSSEELLEALGFEIETDPLESVDRYLNCSIAEKKIIELLEETMDRDEIVRESGMEISDANALLSIMEIKGFIKEDFGEVRRI